MTDVIEVHGPHEALSRHRRGRRRVLHDREGHDLRPARPQRRRQDHGHVDPHRAELRDQRRRSASSAQKPYENARVLSRMCFVRESQKYPDDAKPAHAFRSARLFFPNWDEAFAERLIADFQLPVDRRIKKLSRGQLSAVGVIIGLASRAEITFFDEPYLGLDAVARQIFYDRLLADYAEHPRTVILSSHLIDEVVEPHRARARDRPRPHPHGRDDGCRPRPRLRTSSATPPRSTRFIAGREVIHRESLGRVTSVTVLGALDADDRARLGGARPRRRARVAAAADRPHHPARRRRRRRRCVRHRPRRCRDEPHAERRPPAADQQADLHLDPAAHPGRRAGPHPRRSTRSDPATACPARSTAAARRRRCGTSWSSASRRSPSPSRSRRR